MISIVGFFFLTSCLKTRADLGEQDQSQVYSKKNADNQISSRGAKNSQITAKGQAIIDERDDLIRSLNGRVEGLENQISILQKEKAAAPTGPSAESQKIQNPIQQRSSAQ